MTTSSVPVYLLTYNCAREHHNPVTVSEQLFSVVNSKAPLPEIIAVGLQEVAPLSYSFIGGPGLTDYLKSWKEALHLAESKLFGNGDGNGSQNKGYVQVARKHVGMTALLVFSLRPERIKYIHLAETSFGFWDMANKGAIGAKIGYGTGSVVQMEITVVSAHLAPHEHLVGRRDMDWEMLVRGLVFEGSADADGISDQSQNSEAAPLLRSKTASSSSSSIGSSVSGIYSPASHLLVMGDLNYRTAHIRPTPHSYQSFPQPSMSAADMSAYFARDQLTYEMKAGRTLHGLEEAPITFGPTYKYKDDSKTSDPNVWDWAPHRWPSWCDRILWLPCARSAAIDGSEIEVHNYSSIQQLSGSDHKPVALHISLPILKTESKLNADDYRLTPPFPLDSNWKSKRLSAEKKEYVVGYAILLYNAYSGLALLITALVGSGALWWYVS